MQEIKDDLKLSNLNSFHGTEKYYKLWFGVLGTDGIAYIINNGYSWFVSDAIVVIKSNLKDEPFLSIKLKINKDKTAILIIEDGNEKGLYEQKYNYTNCEKEINLFFTDNVIMLSHEY